MVTCRQTFSVCAKLVDLHAELQAVGLVGGNVDRMLFRQPGVFTSQVFHLLPEDFVLHGERPVAWQRRSR
jgi:hypothetical protein